ncbi:hypothetical protein [Streptomyces catenulae]|uniref:Uncharacterized protein n=1 Tax=Streptomyces catenulae TaxID=66875 RepID=A0ABV2Z6X2_9ACTN|nr:hypothetical protein [Streptomyces catenulae]
MGKASRRKKQTRQARTDHTAATSPEARGSSDPQTLGEEALCRLVRASSPGDISLAGAYALGYGLLGYAAQQEEAPKWIQEIDPLDTLFLGAAFPLKFHDEYEFSNARDAWLRLLRHTVHGKGVLRLVREAVSLSEELALPVDEGEVMLALAGRLEAAGLDQRRLPRRLLPGSALQESRAVHGPSPDLQLPVPPEDAKERIQKFWKQTKAESWADDTPRSILREGLRRFQESDLPVDEEPGMLLPALYAALMAKPGESLECMVHHAVVWATSLDEASPLTQVLDILLVAPTLELTASDTLGYLFAVPAFVESIPSEALLWTSSPGLALPRLAFEMNTEEVLTRNAEITPDMLDWAGMHARMRLTTAARESALEAEEEAETEEEITTSEKSDESWAERRAIVRAAARKKTRKKKDGTGSTNLPSSHSVERIWNADGSSVIHIPADSPHGQEIQEALREQREFFIEKFGREPNPDDPVFFDPEADEPTPLTKAHFDEVMLKMAGHAAELGIDPALIHASREVGYMVTEENKSAFTMAEVIAFTKAVKRNRQNNQ